MLQDAADRLVDLVGPAALAVAEQVGAFLVGGLERGAAGRKGVRDGDIIPNASIDDFLKAGNYGGASCIMDAVCRIDPV